MKRLSRVVLFSALILAGYSSSSFAAAYIFLKNTPQPVPGIDLPGTLTVPANALGGTHPELTFAVPAPVTSQVFLLKNGECLDQGNLNRVGVGEDATGTPLRIDSNPAGYVLTLSVDASATATATCNSNNPVPIRVASVTGTGDQLLWNGTYDVYRLGTIPEPGILALLGLGLSALLLAGRRKAKRT